MPDPIIDLWRRDEEAAFETDVVITRPSDAERQWDPQTRRYIVPGEVIYNGPCRVDTTDAAVVKVQGGHRQHLLKRREVHVPYTVPVEVGDTCTFGASPDPLVDGRTIPVVEVPIGDWTVTRPLTVEERD